MKFRTVTFFRTADGRKPVGEWLHSLNDDHAKAVAIGIKFFEEYPNPVVPKKFFEKVTDHLWEIKTHYGKEQFRLLAFMDDGTIIVAVHGFGKKAMGLRRQQDVDLAEERRRDYFQRRWQKGKS